MHLIRCYYSQAARLSEKWGKLFLNKPSFLISSVPSGVLEICKMQPIHNQTQKFSSIVNVNKSVGNSAHFWQNDTSSPAALKIVYTKQC